MGPPSGQAMIQRQAANRCRAKHERGTDGFGRKGNSIISCFKKTGTIAHRGATRKD